MLAIANGSMESTAAAAEADPALPAEDAAEGPRAEAGEEAAWQQLVGKRRRSARDGPGAAAAAAFPRLPGPGALQLPMALPACSNPSCLVHNPHLAASAATDAAAGLSPAPPPPPTRQLPQLDKLMRLHKTQVCP